jgi:predicted Zn-dependent protease
MRHAQGIAAAALAAAAIAVVLIVRAGGRPDGTVTSAVGTIEQEIALGVQAAPRLADQFGGLARDAALQDSIDRIGRLLMNGRAMASTPHSFDFYVLSDTSALHAVTLLGGQVFFTRGLVAAFEDPGTLAAIVAHELGHGVARHAAKLIARTEVRRGLTGAAALASYDPADLESRSRTAIRRTIDALMNIRYDEAEESEADSIGVELLRDSGYDPNALVMFVRRMREMDTRSARRYADSHAITDHRLERLGALIGPAQQVPVAVR